MELYNIVYNHSPELLTFYMFSPYYETAYVNWMLIAFTKIIEASLLFIRQFNDQDVHPGVLRYSNEWFIFGFLSLVKCMEGCKVGDDVCQVQEAIVPSIGLLMATGLDMTGFQYIDFVYVVLTALKMIYMRPHDAFMTIL